ncbi:Glycero-transferase [Streptococcus pneumoniae]|nr:Glycero-transferase [Streptococcus pneumoniae]COJ50569.1 Glycero-transferase [Streptococcus pneumoniae]
MSIFVPKGVRKVWYGSWRAFLNGAPQRYGLTTLEIQIVLGKGKIKFICKHGMVLMELK